MSSAADRSIPWKAAEWTDSDDRVRGGASQSYLDISKDGKIAQFHGTLDIDTLGGAGFASQRTVTKTQTWDLSHYDGLQLIVVKADSKRYTITLKDQLLPHDLDTGREQSTVSWEHVFEITKARNDANTSSDTFIKVPWKEFKPTFRGKPKDDAKNLDLKNIRRFSILMRSFFTQQKGAFSIELKALQFYKDSDDSKELPQGILAEANQGKDSDKNSGFPHPYTDDVDTASEGMIPEKDPSVPGPVQNLEQAPGFMGRLFEACTKCIRLR